MTGGVRGVGAGISAVFADQGATVVTCARRPVDGLPYEFHACDVRDDDAVAAMVDAIVERHGRIDVVVNNAGGSPYVLTADASAKFNRKIIELNLFGPLSVSQHANRHMQTQEQGGSIVNVASVSGRRPTPGTAAYGAAKAGVESLTATLAVEWATEGPDQLGRGRHGRDRTVRAVLRRRRLDRRDFDERAARHGWPSPPTSVGPRRFLASDAASYISGASLEVHGGGEPPHYLATTTADIK